MSRCFPLALIPLTAGWLAAVPPAPAQFPSYDPDYPPPPGYEGRVFELSQDYPDTEPPAENYPWLAIDFKTEPFLYLRTVLDYGLQGNVEVDWDVASNPVRVWYHAPWMQTGCGGREFVRGLTRERTSRPDELHPNQTEWTDNWAVGMYNPPGGYTVGGVWRDPQQPDPAAADFPIGSVGIKLLFTTATVAEVPYLEGSLEWQANVYPRTGGNPCDLSVPNRPRVMRDLLLLQLDVAVRDDRSEDTGWVFGTFIYDGAAAGDGPFARLVPVGVSWGNDPAIQDRMNEEGAFVNAALAENVVNGDLIRSGTWPDNRAFVNHFGLGGRVNGPIDNPISSCMSCHGLAAQPSQRVVPRVSDAADYTVADFEHFFANVPPGPIETGSFTRLDYSLQLAFGIRAFALCRNDPGGEGCPEPGPPGVELDEMPEVTEPLEPGVALSREGPALEAVEHVEAPPPAPEAAEPAASRGRLWILLIVLVLVVIFLLIRKR